MMKLKNMPFDELMKTRQAINQEIMTRASAMRAQLARLEQASGVLKSGPQLVKSFKLPAKYKDPKTGATWAGRGNRPKWMKGSKSAYLIKAA